MTDLTTDAGIAAVQARLRGESDRLTDADLDAIEQRFAEGRVVNIAAQHQLLAEVRRLQAAVERVREMHAGEPYAQGPDYCDECEHAWPCPTITALDGDEQ